MKRILIIISLVCFGMCFHVQAQSKDGKAPATKTVYTGTGAEIEFSKKVVDFGTLKVGDVKVVTITYTNIGKKPLILDDVISSCDCTEVEWSKAPVMPGKTGTIKATYTAKNVGLISKRITVLSNANTDRVILQLKGEVK
jgi:hypothetical protein